MTRFRMPRIARQDGRRRADEHDRLMDSLVIRFNAQRAAGRPQDPEERKTNEDSI